jgi:hypothetical protein
MPGMTTRRMTTRRHLLRTAAAAIAAPAASAAPATRAAAAVPAPHAAPALLELRSYLCAPGRREALIEMFEQRFLDAYVDGGTAIVGCWRDLDDADRWVWLRGFAGPAERGTALRAFYGSATWRREAAAANATIRDIRPALLLAPLQADALAQPVPPAGAAAPTSRMRVEIQPLRPDALSAYAARFARTTVPVLTALGAAPLATLVTDAGRNHFPRQPVRGEPCFVTLTRFADAQALAAFEAARSASAAWHACQAALADLHAGTAEMYRLQPTARSAVQ